MSEIKDAEFMVYFAATRGKALVSHIACGELLDAPFYVTWDLGFVWLMLKSPVEGIEDIVRQSLFFHS